MTEHTTTESTGQVATGRTHVTVETFRWHAELCASELLFTALTRPTTTHR